MSVYCVVNARQKLHDTTRKVFLNEPLMYNNNLAHCFRLTLMADNGNDPADLTGVSVTANFLRPDRNTVALTGTISGNVVEVVLPNACYSSVGRYKLTVDIGEGSGSSAATRTALIVEGITERNVTSTYVDPGTIMPSINTLISQINSAVDSIPTDYDTLLDTLAPTFSNAVDYKAGEYVWHGDLADGGNLYRFTEDHPAGNWIGTDATAAVITDAVESHVTRDENSPDWLYKVIFGDDSDWDLTDHDYARYRKTGRLIRMSRKGTDGTTINWVNLTGTTHRGFTGNATNARANILANGNSDFIACPAVLLREQTLGLQSYVRLVSYVTIGTASASNNTVTLYAIFRRFNAETGEYEYGDLYSMGGTSNLTSGERRVLSGNECVLASSGYEKSKFETLMNEYDEYAIYLMRQSQSLGGTVLISPVWERVPSETDQVRTNEAQNLTAAQRAQGRGNLSAAGTSSLTNAAYKVPVNMTNSSGSSVNVIANGINSNGADSTNTARARTQYIAVKPSTSYAFTLASDVYIVINAHEYSGSTVGTWIGRIDGDASDRHTVFFRTSATAAYIRLSFAHQDMETEVTSDDRTAIRAAISLSTQTDETLTAKGIPADAGATGDATRFLEEYLPMDTTSWDEVGSFASGTGVVLGWKVGYWDADNSFVTNSTSSVSYWTYFMGGEGKSPLFNRGVCKYLWMTAPEGTQGRIKGYTSGDGGSTYTVQTENITFTGTYRLKPTQGTQYRLGLTGLESASTWLTPENVRTIILRWSPYDNTHHPTPGVASRNMFFTVNVQRPVVFGDATADTETVTVQCVCRMPNTYVPFGKPTRMVFMAHGAHGYVDAGLNVWYSANWQKLCVNLLDAGYGVFDCNVLPGTNAEWVAEKGVDGNWVGYALGSPLYVQAAKAAYDYIQRSYNVYPQIFVHGTSMGGVGATAFAQAFPQLVLAESSFAGRDILRYIKAVYAWIADGSQTGTGIDDGRFAAAWGYEDIPALIADKWSHIDGNSPSLTLTKVNADGTITTAPDRETDFSGWLQWYWDLYGEGRDDDIPTEKALPVGNWIGWRSVPYKCWNSWDDNQYSTKLEQFLRKAFTSGGCAYHIVEYDGYSHDDMCFGQNTAVAGEDLPGQLIAWFKRWE